MFLFKMWAHTGRLVHEITRELNGVQIAEYMAYDQLEPIGAERVDAGFASVCVTMANMWRGKGKRAMKIEEFMLFVKKDKQKTMEDQIGMAHVIHAYVIQRQKVKDQRGD